MNFRLNADMLVLFPKRILAVWRDLTMPRRDWSRLDSPACERLPARSVCAADFPKPTWNHVKFEGIRNERRRLA